MHDTVYAEAKSAAEASPDSRKGSDRGESSGGEDRSNACYQCGKTREEHEDKRFCRKETISAVAEGESLASFLASAAAKNIVKIETLDDLEGDAITIRETCRPAGY